MNKILCLLLTAGLYSCVHNEGADIFMNEEVQNVEVSIPSMEGDFDSRVVYDTSSKKYKWAAGDTVGIFPNKGGQVEFAITEDSYGSDVAKFDGGGWALRAAYTYSAYYPFNFYNRDVKKVPFSYLGQEQVGNDSQAHVGDYTLLIGSPTSAKDGSLIFSMSHVGYIFGVLMELPADKTYTSFELYADSGIIPIKRSYNLLSPTLDETDVEYSNHLGVKLKNISTTASKKRIRVWLAFPYMNKVAKTLKAVVKDSQGYVYVGDVKRNNATFTFEGLERHLAYSLSASPVLTDGFQGGIEDWVNDGNDYGGEAN